MSGAQQDSSNCLQRGHHRPAAVTLAVAALAITAACGHSTSTGNAAPSTNDETHGVTTSSCGATYTLTLPNGRTRNLGSCSSRLNSAMAPTIRVHIGATFTVRTIGNPGGVYPDPHLTARGPALTLTHPGPAGMVQVRGVHPGTGVLTSHLNICETASYKSVKSCTALHVTVSP